MAKRKFLTIKEVNELNAKIAEEWDEEFDREIDRTTRNAKIGLVQKGRKHSEEHRRKIAASSAGYVRSVETRQKLSKALKGRVVTEQARQLISAANKLNKDSRVAKCRAVAKKRSVSVNGVIHESARAAAQALGLDISTLHTRLKSTTEKFKDWFYVDKGPLKQVTHGRKRKFLIIDPDGKEYRGLSVTDFCKEHGLAAKNMSSVCAGRVPHHKGWTGRYID